MLKFQNQKCVRHRQVSLGFKLCLVQLQLAFPENNVEITVTRLSQFVEKIHIHEMKALECILAPAKFKPLEKRDFAANDFKLDLAVLRNTTSSRTDHSWTKAMKKLTIPKDLNVHMGKKSLFHAFRILMYGLQIAKSGTITNWREANEYEMSFSG